MFFKCLLLLSSPLFLAHPLKFKKFPFQFLAWPEVTVVLVVLSAALYILVISLLDISEVTQQDGRANKTANPV